MLIWSETNTPSEPQPLPFVLDLSLASAEHLERILAICGSPEEPETPLSQEKEAMCVSALHLLTLQLHTMHTNNMHVPGLEPGHSKSVEPFD